MHLDEGVEDLECQWLDEDVVHGVAVEEAPCSAARPIVGLQRRYHNVCMPVGGLSMPSNGRVVANVGYSLTSSLPSSHLLRHTGCHFM